MVLVEAMGVGLPVVSFACPCGPRDILKDGETGILVSPGDVKGLAEKICFVIEHQDVRQSMGERAITRAKMFTQERIMQQWIELFESLMKQSKKQ